MASSTHLRETHLGHEIDVEAHRNGTRFFWTYLVDGRNEGRGKWLHDTPEKALAQGMLAAKARVAELG